MTPARFVTGRFATPAAANEALKAVQENLFPEDTACRKLCKFVSDTSICVPLTGGVSDYKAKSFLCSCGALPAVNSWYN